MSVIAGVVNHLEPSFDSVRESGVRLMQALQVFPSDYMNFWHRESVFLGCLGQNITPESRLEKLPFYYKERQLALTADAILDNREDLFQRLQIEPGLRQDMPDSELIVQAYIRWGQAAPRYLIGDYAFMLWDIGKRLLFGARDVAGNRTLYFHHDPRSFAFCTAISPLFSQAHIKRELNERWLAEYLAIPTAVDSTDAYATAYHQIRQLPPGHALTLADGALSLLPYGTLAPAHEEPLVLNSNHEYEEAFRDVFRQAVKSRLRTSKAVGVALSGGLDSGSVASFAARALLDEGKTLYAYSYVPAADFEDWTTGNLATDERPFIQAAARHIGNIQEHYLDSPGRSPLTEADDWLSLLESPYKFFENSFWIKAIYEQAREQGVGVLLTGARGNNSISWGSVAQYCIYLLRRLHWVQFYRQATLFSRQTRTRRAQLFPAIGKLAFPLPAFRASAAAAPAPQLIHPEFAAWTGVYDSLRLHSQTFEEAPGDLMNERQLFFNNLPVLNMQGTSGAKLSLRYGIWERDPTCDPRVIRFCLSVPISQYVQNGMGRSLIRRATAQYLPDKVRLNQRVRGVQGADWVHRMIPAWPAFLREIRELCQDPIASAYLNVSQIAGYAAELEQQQPTPRLAGDPGMNLLMRSLIVYRFLKTF